MENGMKKWDENLFASFELHSTFTYRTRNNIVICDGCEWNKIHLMEWKKNCVWIRLCYAFIFSVYLFAQLFFLLFSYPSFYVQLTTFSTALFLAKWLTKCYWKFIDWSCIIASTKILLYIFTRGVLCALLMQYTDVQFLSSNIENFRNFRKNCKVSIQHSTLSIFKSAYYNHTYGIKCGKKWN